MKFILKKIALISIFFGLILAVAACGGTTTTTTTTTAAPTTTTTTMAPTTTTTTTTMAPTTTTTTTTATTTTTTTVDTTPLANPNKAYYVTGQWNGWTTDDTTGKMTAISPNDSIVSNLSSVLDGVKYLYAREITLPDLSAGWSSTYTINDVAMTFDGNLAVKVIRTAIDDKDVYDWWAQSPESGAITNLTPDTFYIPPYLDPSTVDSTPAGNWNDNPFAYNPGDYYAIFAEFTDGTKGMGLVPVDVHTLLANPDKAYYVTGQFNGWTTVEDSGRMAPISMENPIVANLQTEMAGAQYAYVKDIVLPAASAGWSSTYTINDVATTFDGNLAVKVIRTAIDDKDVYDWWAQSPESGAVTNLTPDTFYIPPYLDPSTVDSTPAGNWNDNPFAYSPGEYYALFVQFSDGTKGMGLVPVDVTATTDSDKVTATLNGINFGTDPVTGNLTLPTTGPNGMTISWATSNADVITTTGEVTLGTFTDTTMQQVTLTATGTLNDATETKTYDITVGLEDASTYFTRVGASIIISSSDQIVSDFTLPSMVLGATVTWASSNTDIAAISATTNTDGFYTVTITRPTETEGNTSVNLTATLTFGDATQDVVKSIRVIAEPPATVYTDFATLHSTASLGDYIDVTGIVYSTFSTGCFIMDSSGNFLAVYYGTGSPYDGVDHKGDEIHLKGDYAVYNTLYQIGSIVLHETVSTGNDYTVTPTVLTDAKDLFNVDYADRTTAGGVYQITVTPRILGTYNNVYLFQGADRVATVYYASNAASIAALKAEAGKAITIDVVYYCWYTGGSALETGVGEVYVTFDGTASDITEVQLTGQAALDTDTLNLSITDSVYGGSHMTLPSMGGYGSSISWAVTSGTDATIDSGVVTFADVTAQSTVTLTATLTLDALTAETKDFVVTINPITTSTIADVLAMDSTAGSVVQVEGVVYAIIQDGYFIQDSTGVINIYVGNGNVPSTLALGDDVILFGTYTAYHGLDEISNVQIKSTPSTGNDYTQTAIVYDGSQTFENGMTYTVTGQVKVEGSYNNVYLYDAAGTTNLGVFYYRSPASSIAALEAVADTGISVTFNLIYDAQDSSGGNQFIFVGGPADITLNGATDAEAVQAALDSINLPNMVTADGTLNLPASLFGVTLTYSSDNTAVITDAGVVTVTSGTQTTVNITVSATLNTTTDTLVIPVQVGEMPVTSIADVIAGSSGDYKIQGTVLADEYYHTYFIQDDTGAMAAYTGDSTLLAFFASNVGNKVEVIGSRSVYSGLYELNVDSATYLAASTVPAPVNVDTVGFDNLMPYQGQWVELTGLTVSDVYTDSYGNMTITLMNVSDGSTIQMKWDSRVTLTSNDLTSLAVGDKVDVQAILGWKNAPILFYTEDAVVTVGTPESDATLVAADAMLFDATETVTGDWTLPTLNFSTATVNSISTELTSYVTDDVAANNQLLITQPTGADVTGTVVFTLTRGSATQDVTVTFTISQAVVSLYSTTFESSEGFTASTTYNNASEVMFGPTGQQWATFYGTVSTTSPIEGLQSMQMRWYTSHATDIPYVRTDFTVTDISTVTFNAANYGNGLNVSLSYSTDGGTTWTGDQEFTLSTTSTQFTYNISGTGDMLVKFTVVLPATAPTSTSRVYLDQVVFN